MYLIIDNYDSFTHNVYQYLTELTDEAVVVLRNDEVTLDDIIKLDPRGIIISPGPGRPEGAGISIEAIKYFAGKLPILGICLGHQSIIQAFGGKIIGANNIVHGKAENIQVDGKGLFRAIPSPTVFTRYHSLVADKESLPDVFEVTATSLDGEIMGVRHKELDIEGVQFHPESIASEAGKQLLKNFLNYRRKPFVVKKALTKLIDGNDMSQAEAEEFMEELTEGNLSDAQIAAFLTALNAKGITGKEIAGCAAVLQRKRAVLDREFPVLDTCGTGGSGTGAFNVSSLGAIVAASCGAMVAKHGNRAVSSKSGSSQFYEALGIGFNFSPACAKELLERTGFVFMFAPIYHSAMRYAAAPRKELGIKTIMNLLGPLVNPAASEYQVIGVFDAKFMQPMAEAAHILGKKRVLFVHGEDGLDEISISGPTRTLLLKEDGSTEEGLLTPADFDISGFSLDDIIGGEAKENAAIAMNIDHSPGIKEAVCINAGAALFVFGKAASVVEGYEMAKEAFTDGRVMRKLEEIKLISKELEARN